MNLKLAPIRYLQSCVTEPSWLIYSVDESFLCCWKRGEREAEGDETVGAGQRLKKEPSLRTSAFADR